MLVEGLLRTKQSSKHSEEDTIASAQNIARVRNENKKKINQKAVFRIEPSTSV